MIELSNEDLLGRLRSGEDNFNERKTFRDKRGWLKTVVAFANSAPIGWPAILFIGVTDAGAIDTSIPQPDLEALQKELNEQLARTYPPVYCLPRILQDEAAHRCLAVLVPGSDKRPHFAGKSYVRVGSESREASEEQFHELIAQRQSKVYELLKWKGKEVTLEVWPRNSSGNQRHLAIVLECSQFFVTATYSGKTSSFALADVEISFDPRENRLLLKHNQ